MLAFGGVEAQLPIFGPDSAAVKGVLENIMAVSVGDEFNVICMKGPSADKWSGRSLT